MRLYGALCVVRTFGVADCEYFVCAGVSSGDLQECDALACF